MHLRHATWGTTPISHIGHTKLLTNGSFLRVCNVLHASSLSHSLASVTKLCCGISAYVEFHPDFFLVKDRVSRKILLQGLLDRGHYRVSTAFSLPASFSPVSSPQLFPTRTTDNSISHQQLDHPSNPIINRVLDMVFIIVSEQRVKTCVVLYNKERILKIESQFWKTGVAFVGAERILIWS